MKIHYNRYTEMSCFTIRGHIGINEWKMLKLGFDMLFKDLEGMLVINGVHAEIPPEVIPYLVEHKKIIPKLTKHKVFIIHKERSIGDFPKLETFLSRFQGSKMRQIGDRIILEDQVYALEQEITSIEAQIQHLGFDEHSSKKEIQKNNMVKTQQRALEECLKWQRQREQDFKAIPSEVEDLELKIKSVTDEITKNLGKAVDL